MCDNDPGFFAANEKPEQSVNLKKKKNPHFNHRPLLSLGHVPLELTLGGQDGPGLAVAPRASHPAGTWAHSHGGHNTGHHRSMAHGLMKHGTGPHAVEGSRARAQGGQ